MTLNLAPDAIVRSGSGLLFLILSLFILATARWRSGHLFLGILFLGFGSYFFLANLVSLEWWPLMYLSVVGLVAPLVFPTRARGAELVGIAIAFAAASCFMALQLAVAADKLDALTDANVVARAIAVCALLAWTMRALLGRDSSARSAHAALALALGVYAGLHAGARLGFVAAGSIPPLYLVAISIVIAGGLLWVAKGLRVRDRVLIWTGMAILVAILAGQAREALFPTSGVDTTGSVGLARIAGWAVVVWAILRHDLLGIGLRGVTIRRGTAAAAALAALFIVAQVAQNFLSASYGLLTGGIVAGALLFAASPIQRAAERMLAGGAGAPSTREDERAAVIYRHALRAALADGAITPTEEEHLAELAQEIGLSHGAALRLRRDEETSKFLLGK